MTAIKICGLREASHVQLCGDLGVEYVGFVAYPKSPRHVSAEEFKNLSHWERSKSSAMILGEGDTHHVLVTVDASDIFLDSYLTPSPASLRSATSPSGRGKLFVQAHGSECPARLRELKSRYGVKIIKALSIATAEDLSQASLYADSADVLLLDAKPVEGEIAGGNARSLDWSILQNAKLPLPWMLSGGLTAQNVAEALRITHAPMVDISSGVESSRGIKSPELIEEFVDAVRHAT
jgi:phosphoribosylanthranilate isomerase